MTGRDGGRWTGLVLGAALVALALVAGLNFTFAVAVMPTLTGVDDSTFVTITQRFNENPVFPLSFTVALLLTALAAALQGWHRLGMGRRGGRASGTALRWTIAALVLYGLVLAITVGLHIPLNEQISQAGDPSGITDIAHVRDRFEGPWVVGNIVRTLFCTAAVAVLARAVLLHGRRTTRGPGSARAVKAAGGIEPHQGHAGVERHGNGDVQPYRQPRTPMPGRGGPSWQETDL